MKNKKTRNLICSLLLAAVLVGFNSYLQHETGMEQILVNIQMI